MVKEYSAGTSNSFTLLLQDTTVQIYSSLGGQPSNHVHFNELSQITKSGNNLATLLRMFVTKAIVCARGYISLAVRLHKNWKTALA